MDGLDIRFRKLFPDSKYKPIIVPVDQGQYFGPIKGVEDLPKMIKKVSLSDALIVAPGELPFCKNIFYSRCSPLQILRLNFVSGYCFTWNYKKSITTEIFDVEFALRLGADWVLASLAIGAGDEKQDLDNINIFTRIVKKKTEWGIPLMGEFYPVNANQLSEKELHKITYEGCRIMLEMGADAIKTNYTGEKFNEIIETLSAPVIVLGGEKQESELESLKIIKKAVDAGANGICVGRNLVQSEDPEKFLKMLIDIVNNNIKPEEVIEKKYQ